MRLWYCANSRSVQLDVTTVGKSLSAWVHLVVDQGKSFSRAHGVFGCAVAAERLHAKLTDPSFRAIEGFPIGDDETIVALSDPP
jgi:hypothetical protein